MSGLQSGILVATEQDNQGRRGWPAELHAPEPSKIFRYSVRTTAMVTGKFSNGILASSTS